MGQKFYPKARKLNNSPIKFHPKRFSWETKIKAVYAMRQPNRSVISVAREYAVSRQTLYARDKEIPNPCIDVPEPVMTPPKRDKPAPEALSRNATVDQRVRQACNRVEFLEKQVTALVLESEQLQKQIRRLQLQKDVLVEVAKILKKDEDGNPQTLSNREKTMVIDVLRESFKLKAPSSLSLQPFCHLTSQAVIHIAAALFTRQIANMTGQVLRETPAVPKTLAAN